MKAYDKGLFARYDGKARKAVIEYLSEVGYLADGNLRRYDPDIVVMLDSGEQRYVEVEVKTSWVGPKFPYPTLRIPLRKMKYVAKFEPLFVVLNRECAYAMAVKAQTIREHMNIAYSSNKYCKNEPFIDIPVEYCSLLDLGDYEGFNDDLI